VAFSKAGSHIRAVSIFECHIICRCRKQRAPIIWLRSLNYIRIVLSLLQERGSENV
jgi:hypothetical protein